MDHIDVGIVKSFLLVLIDGPLSLTCRMIGNVSIDEGHGRGNQFVSLFHKPESHRISRPEFHRVEPPLPLLINVIIMSDKTSRKVPSGRVIKVGLAVEEADTVIAIHCLIGEVIVILITRGIREVENRGSSVDVVDEKLDLADFGRSWTSVSPSHSFIVCSICEHQ